MINKNRFSVSLSKEVSDYLRKTSKETGIKISTLIEKALEKIISNDR